MTKARSVTNRRRRRRTKTPLNPVRVATTAMVAMLHRLVVSMIGESVLSGRMKLVKGDGKPLDLRKMFARMERPA